MATATPRLPAGCTAISVDRTDGMISTTGDLSRVYVIGTRGGKHMVASQVNGDWSGLSVFNNVLEAEFCPAKST
jgi:hypothetical protein